MSESDETSLSSQNLRVLQEMLNSKRSSIIAAISARDGARTDRGERELDDGDRAEQLIEQEASLMLDLVDEKLLAEVEHALGRIANGTYGLDEATGERIPLRRLEALPWARHAVGEPEG